MPDPVAVAGDGVERTAGLDAEWVVRDDGVAAVRYGLLVALLDQKPVLAPFTGGLATHPHQGPVAVQFLAVQLEFEHAIGVGRGRVGILWDPTSTVPQQHRAAAVLPFGNDALEPAIVDRVVLALNCEPLLAGVGARALRDCPTLQDAVELEPKIIVQPACGVLLDDK